MSLPLKLLVDTNVWIDYFLERRPEAHEEAMGFVAEATAADAAFNDAFGSSDFREGAAAFLEKRTPRFS